MSGTLPVPAFYAPANVARIVEGAAREPLVTPG